MNHPITRALATALLAIGCSDTSTGPENGIDHTPTVYGGLRFEYEVETIGASTGEVRPGLGGTLEATASNGVVYTLEVSADAVDSVCTMTITPLRYLRIVTLDGGVPDTSDCLQGAIFEPSGLELNSPATFTISYPQSGLDCDISDRFCVMSFSDSSAFYEIIPTEYDGGASALRCSLTHFSGYGADDMDDYAFLRHLIEEASRYGRDFPGWDVLTSLMSYGQQATLRGWDDLHALAVQGCRPILTALVDSAAAAAQADPGRSTIALLVRYMEAAQSLGFDDIDSRCRGAIDSAVRGYAARGRSECEAGRPQAGRAILREALDWALVGLVIDGAAFAEQVRNWLSDCGDISITLGVDRSLVHNVAVSEATTDMCLITFAGQVSLVSGDPLVGKSVTIRWEEDQTRYTHVVTDDQGNFMARWTGGMVLDVTGCADVKTMRFYAETLHANEWHRSDFVTVTAKSLMIYTSINYQYSFHDDEQSFPFDCTASLRGSGSGHAARSCSTPCAESCNGTLTRTYMRHTNAGSVESLPDEPPRVVCRSQVRYDYVDHGDGCTVPYVQEIMVCGDLWGGLTVEACNGDGDCEEQEYSVEVCDPEYPPPYGCGWHKVYWPQDVTALCFLNGGVGDFDPYLWSYDHPDYDAYATLAITVGLEP